MSLYDQINTKVFTDSDKLRASYVPDEVVKRDEQAQEVITQIAPVVRGNQPDHPFLIGYHGTGKTLVSRYVVQETLDEIESRNEERPPEEQLEPATAFVNCESQPSAYRVALRITNEFLPEDETINGGYSEGELFQKMAEAVESAGDVVLIILDEIGDVDNINSLFYQVTRQGDSAFSGETPIAVISTANQFTFEEKFDSDVLSSADTGAKVMFPQYNAPQLRKIIDQRVEGAFADDVVTESARAALAAQVASRHGGDARHAMKVLMTAGKMAMKEPDAVIDHDLIEQAADNLEENIVQERVRSLPDTATHVLTAFLHVLTDTHSEKIESADEHDGISGEEFSVEGVEVGKTFPAIRENLGYDVPSKPTYYRHLGMVEDSGLVRRQKMGGRNGDNYWPGYPAQRIATAILNDPDCRVKSIKGFNADE